MHRIALSVAFLAPLMTAPGPVELGHWAWPVSGTHRIVRPFIAPATPYSAGHRGIDIAASGDVLAPADGIVHFSGFVVDRDVLSIEHPGDVISSYEPVDSPLRAGDPVTRGEVVGVIEPGHCAELCLHFGVRVHGQYVSPLLFLGGVQRPVLLPTRSLPASDAVLPADAVPGAAIRSGDRVREPTRSGSPPLPTRAGASVATGRETHRRD